MNAIIGWQMPGMNGLETAKGIRRVVGDETSIVILTAYDWTGGRVRPSS